MSSAPQEVAKNLYSEAAAILEKFENKQGSVKSLVFASQFKNVRQLYALVCESLKHQIVLKAVAKKCDLEKEGALSSQPYLATVLLYEHLLGKGLGRAGKIRSCILRHKRPIQEACAALLQEKGVESLSALLPVQCQTINNLPIPRYVRVNLLKMAVDDVIKRFEADGWDWRGKLDPNSFCTEVQSLREDEFASDPLLFDVLVFPPGTDLHDHPLTMTACIVLQDRASCFPAHVLAPPSGATVLDCCAAPGNKTTHTASLMGNTGKIVAFERDAKRMLLLRQQLSKSGVSNTRAVHADFLSVDPDDPEHADVQYILVDPSCSGSGIISRMDHVANNKTSASTTTSKRLQSLARFQISILKHALRFPAAHRVIYSTCSVHEEENEAVVAEVAAQVRDKFCVTKIFPQWSHRGVGDSKVAKRCLRMSPEKDLSNGFFIACFDRIGHASDFQVCGCDLEREVLTGHKSLKKHRKRRKREKLGTWNVSEQQSKFFDEEALACAVNAHQPSSSLLTDPPGDRPQEKKKKRRKKDGNFDPSESKRTSAHGTVEIAEAHFSEWDNQLTVDRGRETNIFSGKISPKKKKKKKKNKDDLNFSKGLSTDQLTCDEINEQHLADFEKQFAAERQKHPIPVLEDRSLKKSRKRKMNKGDKQVDSVPAKRKPKHACRKEHELEASDVLEHGDHSHKHCAGS